MPLCGNGIKDPGELCDDGNKENFDGCNAWCGAFDGVTSACTLAGKNAACVSGKTEFNGAGHPARITFCNLRTLDIDPLQGKYILLADESSVLRMELFTDEALTSITSLNVNSQKIFNPICSISIFPDDFSFLVYECTSPANSLQKSENGDNMMLSLVSSSGYGLIAIANFKGLFRPISPDSSVYPKLLMLPAERDILVAGISTNTSDTLYTPFDFCVDVYRINVYSYKTFQENMASASDPSQYRNPKDPYWDETNLQPYARIPCILYNVFETTNSKKHTTYSTKGMIPRYITREPCIHSYISDSTCFVIYMQRTSDLHFLVAHVPENGRYDIAYLAHSNIMDNALGFPLTRYGRHPISRMKYTLRGGCFLSQSLNYGTSSKAPPSIALGNICNNIRDGYELDCATPFNNPFITDVVSSPELLPENLNSSSTHWTLKHIFSQISDQNNASQSNNNGISSAFFYQDILKRIYGNSTPVDFVEIPSTQDIIYITPISIGLIGTKQFQLFDPRNRGYCKVNDVLYCPPNFFGSVQDGICSPCADSKSPGFGISVAWQVKCASTTLSKLSATDKKNLVPPSILANGHVETGERYSTLLSSEVDESVMYEAICAFVQATNQTCPDRAAANLAPKQQFNYEADKETARETTKVANTETSFIQNLIQKAESRLSRNITAKKDAGEYISTWSSQGNSIFEASAKILQNIKTRSYQGFRNMTLQNKTYTYNETDLVTRCILNSQQGNKITAWLRCAIPFILNSSSFNAQQQGKSRRLLASTNGDIQNASDARINANQDLTLTSSSPILYNPQTSSGIPSPPPPSSDSNNGTGSETFPLWAGIIVGVAGCLVVLILIGCQFKKRIPLVLKSRG